MAGYTWEVLRVGEAVVQSYFSGILYFYIYVFIWITRLFILNLNHEYIFLR